MLDLPLNWVRSSVQEREVGCSLAEKLVHHSIGLVDVELAARK